MSDNQKYYYLRLKDDFFDREEIKVIESLPNGYKYSNILLKLYLKSLKRDGKLMVTDYIPYNLETLSSVLGHDIDTVRSSVELFKQFKLLDMLDNGAIYLLDIQNFIGKSSTEADRKMAYRKRIEKEKKFLVERDKSPDKCPIEKIEASNIAKVKKEKDKCPDKYPPEIEIEKELEIEIEIQQQEKGQLYRDLLIYDFQKNEYESIIRYCLKNDVDVVVVEEKLKIIRSYKNISNKVGALIAAIRDNWQYSKEIKKDIDALRFNNFEGRKRTEEEEKILEERLLGWDKGDDEEC